MLLNKRQIYPGNCLLSWITGGSQSGPSVILFIRNIQNRKIRMSGSRPVFTLRPKIQISWFRPYNSSPLYGRKSKYPDSDRMIWLLSTSKNPNIPIPTVWFDSSLRQKIQTSRFRPYNSSPLYGRKPKHCDSYHTTQLLSTAESKEMVISTVRFKKFFSASMIL